MDLARFQRLRELAAGRKPPTNAELRKIMAGVIREQTAKLNSYKGDSNPQVVLMREKTQSVLDFAEAVERALQGDLTDLRMY